MKKLDKNGDTVLTEDEWSASNGLFKEADADHDGSITPIEFYQLKRKK
jgi:EF hand